MKWQIYALCLLISGGRKVLIESAKTAASASNSTVRNITERLRNISREVERITLTNVSVNLDNMLSDAEQACEYLIVGISCQNITLTYNSSYFLSFFEIWFIFCVCFSEELEQSSPCVDGQPRSS